MMEYHLDKIAPCEVNVEVLPAQVHARLFAVRAGPGKAVPAKSLALRQHGNSRPLRLYPDVMRRSPMCSDTLICALLNQQIDFSQQIDLLLREFDIVHDSSCCRFCNPS